MRACGACEARHCAALTCLRAAVQAKQESISAIFEASGYKKDGKARRVIVTGCLAQRYADELAAELPEVCFWLECCWMDAVF